MAAEEMSALPTTSDGTATPLGARMSPGAGLSLRRALGLVAGGGVLGALARQVAAELLPGPWHTLLVNGLGCLLLGLLVGARRDSAALRAFAGTGVLGGFTTMSTFALESVQLHLAASLAYAAASVVGGLALAAAGLRCGDRLRRRAR
ncbi:MAG: CrcB protein [Frankiales bacterium]|nr:CrcB protein [Frankiales bacterium]